MIVDRCRVNNVKVLSPSSGKLVHEGQSDFGEFEAMAPAESFDRGGIAGRVDGWVVVPGDSLEQHGGGISVLVPTGVVGAGVPTRLIVGGR